MFLCSCCYSEGNREVMMDIYRLLHSTAQRLHEILGYCFALEDSVYTLDLVAFIMTLIHSTVKP